MKRRRKPLPRPKTLPEFFEREEQSITMRSICMTCKPSGKHISHEPAQLATYQIRSPNQAFENTFP